jgi:hypothetical protein
VESVFEHEDTFSSCESPGDLHRIFHRLRPGVEEHAFFGGRAGRKGPKPAGKLHIWLVRDGGEVRVDVVFKLLTHRGQYLWVVVANVQASPTAGEVEKPVSIKILNHSAFGFGHKERGEGAYGPRHPLFLFRHCRPRFRPRDLRYDPNVFPHQHLLIRSLPIPQGG